MIDEMDLLASRNPIPDVRGNPGPELDEPVADDAVRPGIWRHRAARVLPALAAITLVVAGFVWLAGDDDVPNDVNASAAATTPTDAAATASPTDTAPVDPALVGAAISWPDPIAVEVTPETAAAGQVIDVLAGVVVLDVSGNGWSDTSGNLMVCARKPGDDGPALRHSDCRNAATPMSVDSIRSFSERLIAPVGPGDTDLLLSSFDENDDDVLVHFATLRARGTTPPNLRSSSADPEVVNWRDMVRMRRSDGAVDLFGSGWEPGVPLVLHQCDPTFDNGDIDPDTCRAVGSTVANADRTVDTTVYLPTFVTAPRLRSQARWLVATQGAAIAAVQVWVQGPVLEIGARPETFPASITVDVSELDPGQVAELRACASAPCETTASAVVVTADSAGNARTRLEVVEATKFVGLSIDRVEEADVWFPEPVAEIPPGAPPAELSVEPATVPVLGSYDFVVRGTGWIAAPPIFVLPCLSEDRTTCETAELSRIEPVDGAFEMTVTYAVGPSGLLISAGDAPATQTATARVSVEDATPRGGARPSAAVDGCRTVGGTIAEVDQASPNASPRAAVVGGIEILLAVSPDEVIIERIDRRGLEVRFLVESAGRPLAVATVRRMNFPGGVTSWELSSTDECAP